MTYVIFYFDPLCDSNKGANKETAELLSSSGATVRTYTCDVSDKKAVQQTAKETRRDFGDVDILINNAGIVNAKNIMELEEKDIRRTIEINTISHFWVRPCEPLLMTYQGLLYSIIIIHVY